MITEQEHQSFPWDCLFRKTSTFRLRFCSVYSTELIFPQFLLNLLCYISRNGEKSKAVLRQAKLSLPYDIHTYMKDFIGGLVQVLYIDELNFACGSQDLSLYWHERNNLEDFVLFCFLSPSLKIPVWVIANWWCRHQSVPLLRRKRRDGWTLDGQNNKQTKEATASKIISSSCTILGVLFTIWKSCQFGLCEILCTDLYRDS